MIHNEAESLMDGGPYIEEIYRQTNLLTKNIQMNNFELNNLPFLEKNWAAFL